MNLLAILTIYLFSYFTGERDGLHLAWSNDGYHWTPLAGNSSLLTPVIGEDKLMRDPSICQGPDGTFHMVWTSSWHDRIIGYASSKDLVHWSGQKAIPVMMHEPEAHNCWAPELFYDAPSETYYIYWATTIPGRHSYVPTTENEKGLNHRIYCTTTKDFETFTPTEMFFNPDFSVIDAAIVRDEADDDLIMFVKNENSAPAEKNIRITRSKDIRNGFPTAVSEPVHGKYWSEGPAPLYLEDGTLIVYFDRYMDGKYGAAVSRDNGRTWSDVPDEDLSFPEEMRHGTAFKITDEQFNTLQMNIAVQQRHSVRHYKDVPLSQEHIAFLQEEIKKCNSGGNLDFKLVTDEHEAFGSGNGITGRFSNADNYIVLIAKDAPDAAERTGYFGEKIVLAAQAAGLNTCWVAGSYNRVEKTMSAPDGYRLFGVISIGYGAETGKFHTSKSFSDVTEGEDFPEWFVAGVESALLAPTAMNRQMFTFSWDGRNAVASAPQGDYEQVSLGIAEYHFELASGHRCTEF